VGKKLSLYAERRSHTKLSHVANTVLSVKTVNASGNKVGIKLNLGLYSYWSGDIHNFIKILIFTEFDWDKISFTYIKIDGFESVVGRKFCFSYHFYFIKLLT
jgi:hypothetical protein